MCQQKTVMDTDEVHRRIDMIRKHLNQAEVYLRGSADDLHKTWHEFDEIAEHAQKALAECTPEAN